MSERLLVPRVPDELISGLTDHVLETVERWQSYSRDDIAKMMPDYRYVRAGAERHIGLAVLSPQVEHDGENIALFLPHQQAWKPSMFIRAELGRQIVNPHARMYVFPNNSMRNVYYSLTDLEQSHLHVGDLGPLARLQARALGALGVDTVRLSGYSLGGRLAVEVAAQSDHYMDIKAVNADEAPSKRGRNSKELQRDFLASGTWGAQRQAIKDAAIPVLSETLSAPRLGVDYARFGLAAALNPQNKAIKQAMTGDMEEALSRAIYINPGTPFKIGYVIGSSLFEAPDADRRHPRLSYEEYNGEGAHAHSTGDNPLAHGLMMDHGFRLAA
jgi:hypothetical protein